MSWAVTKWIHKASREDQVRGDERPWRPTRISCDDRILREIVVRLSKSINVKPSGIQIEVKRGEVILKGTVETSQMKEAAELCLEDIWGIRRVHVELRVSQPRPE